jgi:hypothetical protein
VRPIAGAAIAAMLVAIGLPLAATSASAVVRPGHIINVFPNRDAVNAQGYTIGTSYTVNVLRGGSVVGTSLAVARPNVDILGQPSGWIDINEAVAPPIGPQVITCWGVPSLNVTPDIRPGDVVQVVDGTSTDETTVAGVTLLNPTPAAAYDPVAGTFTLTGTAPGATVGSRLPLVELEARVNAKKTQFSAAVGGKASIRALSIPTKPGEGILTYDSDVVGAVGYTSWTAKWTGMNTVNPLDSIKDGDRAMASIQAGVWSLPNLTESTSSEVQVGGAVAKGPLQGVPGCSAPAAKGPSIAGMTPATDTGVLGDLITKNPTPTFTGFTGMLDSTTVSLFVDGVLNGTTTAIGALGAYSITPTTALAAGSHTITVGETGPTAGLMLMGTTSSVVTIDMTSPAVTGRFPANTATGTTTIGNVTATFNEALDPSTVTPATFTLKNAGGTAVPAVTTYNPATKVITLDPFASLVVGTTYTVAMTGITDVAGNSPAAPSWTFTTATSLVASYINRVYLDLFNRTPDPGGLAGWTAKLNTGTPRIAVANAITGSPEYRSTLITASYLKYLGRSPDPVGLRGWLAAMNSGYTVSRMEGGFIASPEYYAKAGSTDATWVVKLYFDVLGRAAAPSEVNHWTTSLSAGASRNQVAMGFLLSTERLSTVVNGYYQHLLGRAVDPTGLVAWVKKLQAGAKNETIIGGIIASPEYFSHN